MIVTYDDPEKGYLLMSPSVPCSVPPDENDQKCIDDLKFLMENDYVETALGIAAIQVGYPKRIFVMKDTDGSNLIVVNPEIVSQSREKSRHVEGCLSIPGFSSYIKRPKSITIRFTDESGCLITREFKGLMSRVVCHELDHLNGILISKHANDEFLAKVRVSNERKHAKEANIARSRAKEKRRRKQRSR